MSTTAMKGNPLGKSGLSVSAIGLGANNFGGRIDEARTKEVVLAALDSGINHIDTADVYGNKLSEQYIGKLLRGRRDEVVIATKFGAGTSDEDGPGGSSSYVRQALDASLKRLQTDFVGLYYYHRFDGVTPFEETLGTLNDLVGEGKIRAFGCSALTKEQLLEVIGIVRANALAPLTALQNQYSLLEREAEELIDICQQHEVAFVPYFPLASGLLTGKYKRGKTPPEGTRLAARPEALTDDKFDVVEQLEDFAARHGHTVLELAIGGLSSRPGVTSVISGATSAEQVRANVAAGAWVLTEAERAELEAVLELADG